MHKNVFDLTGVKIGRWTVIKRAGSDKHRYAIWLCMCECGTKKKVAGHNLLSGRDNSCGCLRIERLVSNATKHGHAPVGNASPEYTAWQNMKSRCLYKGNTQYQDYGLRGIKICDRWKNSFAMFFADMGKKPSHEHTLERIDNDGNYEPTNCRWATRKEQARNKRTTRLLTFEGRTMSLVEWGEVTGLGQNRIERRLNGRKWTVAKTLTTPIQRPKSYTLHPR